VQIPLINGMVLVESAVHIGALHSPANQLLKQQGVVPLKVIASQEAAGNKTVSLAPDTAPLPHATFSSGSQLRMS